MWMPSILCPFVYLCRERFSILYSRHPEDKQNNILVHALLFECGEEWGLIKPGAANFNNARHLTSTITISSDELIQDSSLLASQPQQDVNLWPHVTVSRGTATFLHSFILDPVPPRHHQARLLMQMGPTEDWQSTCFPCCCGFVELA